ncbi:MAG TPA: DivIVA domain-containing protein [Acidimicrobiales bacterium]|nr:DivIVA domain-containing protein [Acidimicrobiales bacterium]
MTSSLSPDDVTQRTFATSFRGFDPGEVRTFLGRVAAQLREAEERAADLAERLAAAEERVAHPQLDVDTLTTALGEETARILKSAQDAAHDIRAKAEENIAQLLREAYEDASRLRADAELVLAKETEGAEAAAAEIRATAEAEATAALGRARQEAERLLGEVEAKARLMVEEAEASRARILDDLARRRRVAHAQVEQLRAGRERLLEAYRVVRTTLDEVTEELVRAESEARHAADEAARRADVDPLPPPTVEAEPEPAAGPRPEPEPESESVSAPEPESAPEPVAEEPPLPEEPGPEADATVEDDEVVELPPSRRLVGTPVAPPVTGPPTEEWRMSSLRIIRPPKVEEPEPESESAPEPVAEEPPLPEEPVPAAEVAEPEPDADERPAASTVASAVDELFARIRAEAPAAEPEAPAAEPEPEPVSEPQRQPAPVAEAEPAEAAVPSDDEAVLQRRDGALEEVDSRLARRLKRALQDDHNDVLDRLRVHRGRVHAEALLPTAEAHPSRFREVAASLLGEAAAAGARFIEADPAEAKLDDLVNGLADDVVGPLRRRLERSFDEGADEEHALVVERIGAAYREAKGRRIEQLASDYAVAAFSRGTLAAVAEGSPLRWIVDDAGDACPDCDDNALAGPTPCGAVYPTGQTHPPAHAGCRCLVVPAAP